MLVAPFDCRLPPTAQLQPDPLVAHRSDIGPVHVERPPLLVVGS